MFNWLRELLEVKTEYKQRQIDLLLAQREAKHCESCETLKMQLSIANETNERLLSRLLSNGERVNVRETETEIKAIMPRTIPWKVRQQALEAEDRHRAQLLRKQSEPIATEELEKEMDTAAANRESGGVQDATK